MVPTLTGHAHGSSTPASFPFGWKALLLTIRGLPRPKRRFWVFAAIALVNLIVYFPSFSHTARGDQIVYLAEYSGVEDWYSLAVKSYAYERTRGFNPGDELFFRPMQWFLIGTERWLFGYEFIAWQATGFLLHLCVLWRLLLLLMDLGDGLLAPLLALFFSVLCISAEMAVWQHTHGYQLFALFLLGAIHHSLLHVGGGAREKAHLVRAFLWALAATFTFETGGLFSAFLGGYVLLSRRTAGSAPPVAGLPPAPLRWAGAALLIPPLLYAIASAADYSARGGPNRTAGEISANFEVGLTLKNAAMANLWWFHGGVLPWNLAIAPGERTYMVPKLFEGASFADRFTLSTVAAVLVMILCFRPLRAHPAGPSPRSTPREFIALVLLMLLSYGFILAVGRLNARGLEWNLMINPYYSHLFWLLLLVALQSWAGPREEGDPRYFARRPFLLLVLVGLTLANGTATLQTNLRIREWSAPRNRLVRDIRALVAAHTREPDFTFTVDPGLPENDSVPWLERPADRPSRRFTLAEALFRPYFRPVNAKYIVGERRSRPP